MPRGAKQGRTKVTPAQDRIIKKEYLNVPCKRLSDQLGISDTCLRTRMKQLGLVVPAHIIEQRKKDSRIKPGHVPSNKGKKQTEFMSRKAIARTKATRFKKGHLPHNAVGFKDGDITVRQDHKNRAGKSYKYIRLSLGKWYPLHQYRWEKKHGKLPKGHCLWFIDGDTMNCSVSNLELITRAENMRRNSCSLRLTDVYVANTLARKKGRVGAYDKELRDILLQDKDLIEMARQTLLLKRVIKSKSNGKEKQHNC